MAVCKYLFKCIPICLIVGVMVTNKYLVTGRKHLAVSFNVHKACLGRICNKPRCAYSTRRMATEAKVGLDARRPTFRQDTTCPYPVSSTYALPACVPLTVASPSQYTLAVV